MLVELRITWFPLIEWAVILLEKDNVYIESNCCCYKKNHCILIIECKYQNDWKIITMKDDWREKLIVSLLCKMSKALGLLVEN